MSLFKTNISHVFQEVASTHRAETQKVVVSPILKAQGRIGAPGAFSSRGGRLRTTFFLRSSSTLFLRVHVFIRLVRSIIFDGHLTLVVGVRHHLVTCRRRRRRRRRRRPGRRSCFIHQHIFQQNFFTRPKLIEFEANSLATVGDQIRILREHHVYSTIFPRLLRQMRYLSVCLVRRHDEFNSFSLQRHNQLQRHPRRNI